MVAQEAYDDLKRKYDDLEAKYDRMLPLVNYLQRHLFGKSSERHEASPANPLQPSLFAPEAPVETVIVEKEQITYERTKKAAIKHPGRKPLNTDLPREVIEVLHAEADPATMERIGEQVTEQLAMRPAQFYVKQYVYPKYRDAISGKIYQAPAVDGSFARFSVDESVAAHVVVQKLVDHLPLYRQARIFERQRVDLSESTLGDLFTQVSNQLTQVYEAHRQEMMASGYLNVDETTIQVMDSDKKGATHQGYYWVYYDPVRRSVLFDYDRGRSQLAAHKTLTDFQGYLQSDGYQAYDSYEKVPGITMVGCMAHARRKFFDAKAADKLLAEEALNLFGAVYAVEKHIREEGLTGDEKLAFRQKHAVPALAALHAWMTQQYEGLLRPSSPIRSAIEYTLKRWDKLTIYASTHLLDIDNNKVENAIRPVTIGRKNYMFAGSHEAAQRSAMLYSLLGTCKANGINPFEWLKVTLKKLHSHPVSRIKELLPHNFQAENQG
jgi:transposase